MGWQAWELDPEKIPLFKLIFHVAQIVLAFVVWCLEIAVFKADKVPINGQNGWTFAVVRFPMVEVVAVEEDQRLTLPNNTQFFISIPAWIYLGMAPRFPRTRKLAQPHAMVVVDAAFAIIWLSAFSTQAAFNTAGSCMSVCGISKAIVGLGFFVLYVSPIRAKSPSRNLSLTEPLSDPQPLLLCYHVPKHLHTHVLQVEQPSARL